MNVCPDIVLETGVSQIIFAQSGDVLSWKVDGVPVVLDRPVRQNTKCDFQGIQIWTKSFFGTDALPGMLPMVEYDYEATLLEKRKEQLRFLRCGDGWKLEICWTLSDRELRLDAKMTGLDSTRSFQIEFLNWIAYETPVRGVVAGIKNERDWEYRIPRFGKVQTCDLDEDSELKFVSYNNYVVHQKASRPHIYHRGLSLKMGAVSDAVVGENTIDFDARIFIEPQASSLSMEQVPSRKIELPAFARDYKAGLMLHLQYTQHPVMMSLLKKWILLTKHLQFDFMLLELGRALRVHPACSAEALSLEDCAELAQSARNEGLEIIPCYNLLGHQFEYGILEWKPEWRETVFDGLCVSHPEVRTFVAGLLRNLQETFQSRWIHVGGDELKFPNDGKKGECPRCKSSPDLDAIVDYWNFMQKTMGDDANIAIWGDQLLPPDKVEKGLAAHNWDGRAVTHLENLDRSIHIIDWQYSTINPETSQAWLTQAGHKTGLASGQYVFENPFIHADICRRKGVDMAIHTTWASPHPADCPLESIAAAARAHAGEAFDMATIDDLCRKDAEWMFDYLSGD